MSGIGIAAASGVTATGGGGGSPLSVSLSWTGGTPTAVTGASGVPASAVLVVIASGGTPPYTDGTTLTNNPSGKLFVTGAPDGVHNTVGWSGFALNETESFTARYSVTDSVGATKSASVSSSIRRTN